MRRAQLNHVRGGRAFGKMGPRTATSISHWIASGWFVLQKFGEFKSRVESK